ncbi:LexA family transcriptional regulator [uncultured Phascolarctobacterium sp.]|uniref:LexA family protein n=1 Tax=uncultured Phascolarctobacterium sp. TaxID=512296 RepID=UPI0025CBC0CE|nr:LexA family transcriptional regulator [uncultured Phascolarctobacterium sp.]
MKIGEYVKQYREEHGLSMQAFGDKCGLSRAYISILEKGINPTTGKSFAPTIETLKKIADVTNTNLDTLLKMLDGTQVIVVNSKKVHPSIPNDPNIFPIERKKIPMLGKIACGQPIMSEEVFVGYVQCNGNIHADFCLRAAGDSMINARIYDGDIVFIRQQPEVENGEIAAVSIDGSVTLKRVYLGEDYVELKPENPTYKPLRFNQSDFNSFRILGKAIAFQGDII